MIGQVSPSFFVGLIEVSTRHHYPLLEATAITRAGHLKSRLNMALEENHSQVL